jgi:hypothetical protein
LSSASTRPAAPDGALEGRSVVGFKGSQAGIEQLAIRYDDHVEARSQFISTENLSNQSFSSVSLDRVSELSRCRDAEPSDRQLVRQNEHRAVAAAHARAVLVNLLKSRAGLDPFIRSESRQRLSGADRQPLAALGSAALEHQAPVLGAHTHEEPMRLPTMSRIRLKRPLPLHISPMPERTANVSVRVWKVSMHSGLCYSRVPSIGPAAPSRDMRVWSLPKVFHTCGKNCGNSPDLPMGEVIPKPKIRMR